MSRLESLEDYNRRRIRERPMEANRQLRPNGIACPGCGIELRDTMLTLLTNPPKMRIVCINPDCEFEGSREL